MRTPPRRLARLAWHARVAGGLACACASSACAESAKERARADMAVLRAETTPAHLQARGDAAAVSGDFTRAEQYYVAALRAGGDEGVLAKRLLIVCVTDGRYPAAASHAEDYLRRHPGDTDLRYALATVYIGLGDPAAARAALEQVIGERPDDADAHYALATVLREQGEDLRGADLHFREYIRLDPKGPFAEAARASLLRSVP
ncbi:MAG: tetratricopeptide repeat protein [Myxococcales bacterium]|nr:tetratricopeptide repeat protein [Myxococcales bacterium]